MPALPVLKVHGESFHINNENFNSVLEKVLDLPVVIVSINGKLREGKSYVLNYFIRYLTHGGNENWFVAELPEDEMFPWRSGSHRVTAGINIWSEPFIHDHNGQQVAVLFLDCQGLYDECTTHQQNVAIFSLSCLLSSVLIYNAKNKIEDDLLHKLGFFSNYTKAVSTITPGHEDTRPYLMFLLRDFEFISEYDFGFHNKDNQPQPIRGERKNYFERIFTATAAMTKENRSIREALRECYNDIGMYLMPYPGTNFIEDSVNNKPESRFQKILKELVEHTMDNLVTKRLGVEQVTGRSFQPYVNMWAELCKNGEFPESLTIEEMSAKLQNTVAVSQALETFKDKFRMILSLNNAGYGDDNFNSQFNLAVEESVDFFYSKISLGSNDAVKSFEDALRSDCASYFHEHCVPINLNRRQETNTAAVTHAQRYFNMKFHDFLSSARAGTGEESFEGLFDFHFNCAVNIFHDNRCSESASSVQAYIDALNRDCRTHFEENCKPLNQRLRHERNTNAVGLALENFKQEFHEFLSSDEAGIEDEMFSEMEPRALYSAEQVFQRNRSSGSDASIQSYLNNLREACHRHFLEECVPMNQSLRLIWQLKVGLITVVGVGTIYAAGTMVAAETAVGAKALAAKTTTGGETNAAVRQYLSTETVNKLISSADRITVAAAAVAGIFSKLHTASNHNNNN